MKMKAFPTLMCLFAVTGLFLSAGCGGGSTGVGGKAAILPESNFVMSFDMQAIQNAPVFADVKKDSQTTTVLSQFLKDFDKETADSIKQSLDIEEEDLNRMTVSADLDNLNLDAPGSKDLAFAVGLDFAKEMTNEKLKEAFTTITEKKGGSLAESDGMLVVTPPDKQDEQPAYISASGKTVFAGTGKDILTSVLKRHKSSKAAMPSAVSALKKEVGDDVNGMILFSLPESLKKTIREKLNQPPGTPSSPAAGMVQQMLGMFKPFQSLANVVATVKADETMHVKLILELGGEQEAQEASKALVQLLHALSAMSPMLGQKQITPNVDGAKIVVPLELTKDDVNTLQKQGAGAIMPGMQGMPGNTGSGGAGARPPVVR